ncbi:hypothetical protein RCL1_004902 [Eukaryota sp. TZLM3-RCL]
MSINVFFLFLVLFSNSWKKDLTVDGDVEANPGPSDYECSALDESWLDDFTIDNYISSLVSTTPTVFYVEVNIVERTFFKELMGDFTWFTDVYNKPGDFVFLIPINDFYVFPTEARGAHWSLLVFERFKDIRNFYYIDSLYNTDCLEAAQIIVSKLNLEQTNLTFHELECIQQPNGFDCGVYTCWYAFLVLQVYHCHHNVPILEIESACKNGPPDISTFREDLEKLDISMIQSKHLASQHERLSKFIRYVQRQGKSPHVLEHPRFEHVACRDLELTVDIGQWNIVDLLPLVPEPFPEPHSEVIDVVFPIDVNLEEHSPIPMSPVGDAIFPNVNPHVAKGVSKKPKTAKPPKSSTSSRTLSKKELKEKKFFKTRPLTRRVYTPNPDLEKKIKAEKAKKRSRQSDQNFEKKIRSSTLQIPVNDENKILYKQLYDSIPGKSSRQKRRMMNFHLVGRHFLEAETLLQQSLIDRETDVGHLNGRKTKDKETVFGPKIDIPTPKVNSSFVAEKKPKGTPKKGKQSKKPKKDLIAFASEDEFDFNDSSTVMSIDIETRRKTDRPVTTISNSLKKQREQESKELKSMKDEEKEQWIQDQEVFMISAIFGHFNRDQFLPVDARVYTLYVTDLNSLRLPDFCTSVHNCVSELNLLEQFINFIVEMGPDVVTGFNTTNFDLRVLDNRFNHYNLEIPSLVSTFQPDVSLSQFWNRVKTDHWFSVSCDCYLYARKFIASKRGFSLRCPSHFLLNETKFRLHTNEFLLPIDFISSKPQDVINYCFQDSLLALKLFLLFQRNKVIRPTYVTHKTTLQQIVKHRGLELLLQYYAQLVQHLRINTSLCFKMFVINQLENDQELPVFTTSDFDHILTLLKQISSEHYGITVAKGKKPQIDPVLQNFVNTEFRSIMEVHGYSF